VYKSSQVYRDCTNSVPTVYQSSKTVKVCRIHMSTPTVQQYQQCCRLANGNKTCRYLLLFKNNKGARGSQGFVGQISRNVALRVEHPSVTSFFSELQYSAAFGRESRKFAVGVWKYAKFRHFLAHPVVLGWPGKNPSSNFSNDNQGPPRVKLSRTSVNQGRRIRRP